MSAAPYGLRDIQLPAPPDWAMAALLLVLVAGAALLAWRRRWHRSQRESFHVLSRIEQAYRRDGDESALVRALSALLRAHALVCYPGHGVAGLTGDAWLQFLDQRGGNGAFARGPGKALATRPYQCDGTIDAPALLDMVRGWLRGNRP